MIIKILHHNYAAELFRRQKSFLFMFFFRQSFCAFYFPLLKLALAFVGFKERADIWHHIVHDGLQDVFRHVAFGTAVAESIFNLNAQACPKAAVFVLSYKNSYQICYRPAIRKREKDYRQTRSTPLYRSCKVP